MSTSFRFGPFTLVVEERRLMRGNAPIDLGARAFDILTALCERGNEVVGKAELLARAWPDVVVDEGSLRFHMSHLRKSLGDGRDGARYIATLPGRGYCLVEPVSRSEIPSKLHVSIARHVQTNLPASPHRMLGRTADVAAVSAQLAAARFVTLVGPGGIGKTTIALAIGHDLVESFSGAVHFVDFSVVADPMLVGATVASVFGLSLEPNDAVPGLLAYIANRRDLIILDTCEHVVEAAAELARRLFSAAPQVHILVTSREPLRTEGERVYKLEPLAFPPEQSSLSAAEVRQFPAVQLFIECAEAGGARLDLDSSGVAEIAEICRKLDGAPLAIELAAARVASFGLAQTASLLGERLALSWSGHRTAPLRQKSLQATFDWSYELLSELERLVLRRLAAFVGHFSIGSALAVARSQDVDETQVFRAIDGLVAKSMLAARPLGAMMRYRLLDPTRAYARQLAMDDTETADIVARHARVCLQWAQDVGRDWPNLSSPIQRSLHLAGLANLRVALQWAFDRDSHSELAVELTVAAAPILLSMSLLTECQSWSLLALARRAAGKDGGFDEMRLQSALGVSLMFTSGGKQRAFEALTRSLRLAEAHGHVLDQIRILAPLQMFHLRTGGIKAALDHAERCARLAERLDDPVSAALANSLMGISLHLKGDQQRARGVLEAAIRPGSRSGGATTTYLGFDGGLLAAVILARTLCLQGFPEQAAARVRVTIRDAEALNHPLTLAIVLVWSISIHLYLGDLDSADENIHRLSSWAESHALGPYLLVGQGFEGELAIRRGRSEEGVRLLRRSLAGLRVAPYELLTTPLSLALVQGLVATQRHPEAIALLDETMQAVESHGDHCYMPELLRTKGALALAAPQSDRERAERCLRASLDESRRQGARAWELRAACDLARLLQAKGERKRARECLRPVLAIFTETAAEVQAAASLLAAMNEKSMPPDSA